MGKKLHERGPAKKAKHHRDFVDTRIKRERSGPNKYPPDRGSLPGEQLGPKET